MNRKQASISVRARYFCVLALALAAPCCAMQAAPQNVDLSSTVQVLMDRLAAAEAQIKDLQQKLSVTAPLAEKPAASPAVAAMPLVAPAPSDAGASAAPISTASTNDDPHSHMMEIPGGPALKIRGFFDFNYGVGRLANPLIFPLGAPAHSTFQTGEFDLFMSSKLSEHLDFVAELVVGPDATNEYGLDLERYQLTYRGNEYFQISAGRYHTAIGYYNTAFHHGTWFQTTTGRPFMYYFEDSGGLLPVHNVGVTATGLVPGTGGLKLHWIAEGGNGRSSSNAGAPVQTFLADRNRKSVNFAVYATPEWVRGLQFGASWYRDRLAPDGIPHVNQTIASAHVVYITSRTEFLNEAVLLTNRFQGQSNSFRTPLMYTQVSRRFGKYRPFFRYQYVNSPGNDPVNVYTDRYQGPSVGLRMDFSDFAAFKLQYNRLNQRQDSANGLDAQIAYTF